MKDNSEDIMKIELGNFPAQEHLSITFSFVEPLDIIASQYWKFVIPSALTPRYKAASGPTLNNPTPSTDINTNFLNKFAGPITTTANVSVGLFGGCMVPGRVIEYIVEQPYTWNIKLTLYQTAQDSQLFCATHKN